MNTTTSHAPRGDAEAQWVARERGLRRFVCEQPGGRESRLSRKPVISGDDNHGNGRSLPAGRRSLRASSSRRSRDRGRRRVRASGVRLAPSRAIRRLATDPHSGTHRIRPGTGQATLFSIVSSGDRRRRRDLLAARRRGGDARRRSTSVGPCIRRTDRVDHRRPGRRPRRAAQSRHRRDDPHRRPHRHQPSCRSDAPFEHRGRRRLTCILPRVSKKPHGESSTTALLRLSLDVPPSTEAPNCRIGLSS